MRLKRLRTFLVNARGVMWWTVLLKRSRWQPCEAQFGTFTQWRSFFLCVMCAGARPDPREELPTSAFGPTCLCHWACLSLQAVFSLDPWEGDPADTPSRVYDGGKVGNKSTGLSQYQTFRVNTVQKLHNESDQSIVSAHQSYVYI